MKIAVLSGKGGTGKTFFSTNLACAFQKASYIDCDVEEPNGHLFLKPKETQLQKVYVKRPVFDEKACNGCKKGVDFCRFNALIYIKKKPIVFTEVCHACGGCSLVCPEHAIQEENREIGHVEVGKHKDVTCITGYLNPGEASGIPVIQKALGQKNTSIAIIDCPPGSACSVMESVMNADVCVLVAEPSAFGFHNFKMVYELVTLLKKPCKVVMNKIVEPYPPLLDFCTEHHVDILAKIPYSKELATCMANSDLAYENIPEMKTLFDSLVKELTV